MAVLAACFLSLMVNAQINIIPGLFRQSNQFFRILYALLQISLRL